MKELKEFYVINDGMACVVGTTYSFEDVSTLEEYAKQNGWELEEVDAPSEVTEDAIAW